MDVPTNTVTVRVRVGATEGVRETEAHGVGVVDWEGERVTEGDSVWLRATLWVTDRDGEALLLITPLPLLDTLGHPLEVDQSMGVVVRDPVPSTLPVLCSRMLGVTVAVFGAHWVGVWEAVKLCVD